MAKEDGEPERWGSRRGSSPRLVTGMCALFLAAGLVACSDEPTAGERQTSTPVTPGTPSDEAATAETESPGGREAPPECLRRAVTITGSAGPDLLRGTRGRDVIATMAGDDVVTDVDGHDRVCTGNGADRVHTAKGDAWSRVDLGPGNDVFRGSALWVMGGPGADQLYIFGGTKADPGPGGDVIITRPVKDLYVASCLTYGRMREGIVANLARGWVQAEGRDRVRGVQCVYGTPFTDRLTGSRRDDLLDPCSQNASRLDRVRNFVHSGSGDDQVNGCAGGDVVHLGAGRDVFMGGAGDDWVYGGDGPDAIHGIYGSDHLEGGNGDDRVNGTFFCDTASSAGDGMGDSSPNQVYGGNGDDEVTGDLAADLLDGGPGQDNGYGGPPGREGGDVVISVEQRTSCP